MADNTLNTYQECQWPSKRVKLGGILSGYTLLGLPADLRFDLGFYGIAEKAKGGSIGPPADTFGEVFKCIFRELEEKRPGYRE